MEDPIKKEDVIDNRKKKVWKKNQNLLIKRPLSRDGARDLESKSVEERSYISEYF